MPEKTTYRVMIYRDDGECVSDLPLVIFSNGEVVTGGVIGDAMLPKAALRAMFFGSEVTAGPLAETVPLGTRQEPLSTSAPLRG